MTQYGWDMSHYDWDRHPVSLADARRAGISFVTHKATEGNGYRDPRFGDYVAQVKTAGMPVAGAYHVLNGDIDVASQVDYHIATVAAALGSYRHPCWIEQLDCEPLDGHPAPSKAQIIAAAERLRSKMGLRASQIVVYGPHWVYGDSLAGLPYKLWASSYVNGSGPFKSLYPGDHDSRWDAYSGQTPLVVQYSSSSQIGAQHTCDANAIRVADEAALRALFVPAPTDLMEVISNMDGAPKNYAQLRADLRADMRAENTYSRTLLRQMVGFAIVVIRKGIERGWFNRTNIPDAFDPRPTPGGSK